MTEVKINLKGNLETLWLGAEKVTGLNPEKLALLAVSLLFEHLRVISEGSKAVVVDPKGEIIKLFYLPGTLSGKFDPDSKAP